MNTRAIERVLAGDGSYDLLGEREQAVVRASGAVQAPSMRASLDFAAEFQCQGEGYSEGDDEGSVVIQQSLYSLS